MKRAVLTATSLVFALSAVPAFAEHAHRLHMHRSVAGFRTLHFGDVVDYAPGEIIRDATERAQREPGVTSELAPDAKQTATGGPVGGVPGFEGGQ